MKKTVVLGICSGIAAFKTLELIKKLNPRVQLIAFKAEYASNDEDLINAARKLLNKSQIDAVVANDISKADRGFETEKNEVIIVYENGKTHKIALNSKRQIAEQIIDYLMKTLIIK